MSAKVVQLPRSSETLPTEKLTDPELADQFGEFDRRYKACAPRRSDLMAEAQKRCEAKAVTEQTVIAGSVWRVVVGARTAKTVLPGPSSLHRMFRAAQKDFYSAITVTQTAIKEALGAEAFARIARVEHTGYRPVTAQLAIEPKAA